MPFEVVGKEQAEQQRQTRQTDMFKAVEGQLLRLAGDPAFHMADLYFRFGPIENLVWILQNNPGIEYEALLSIERRNALLEIDEETQPTLLEHVVPLPNGCTLYTFQLQRNHTLVVYEEQNGLCTCFYHSLQDNTRRTFSAQITERDWSQAPAKITYIQDVSISQEQTQAWNSGIKEILARAIEIQGETGVLARVITYLIRTANIDASTASQPGSPITIDHSTYSVNQGTVAFEAILEEAKADNQPRTAGVGNRLLRLLERAANALMPKGARKEVPETGPAVIKYEPGRGFSLETLAIRTQGLGITIISAPNSLEGQNALSADALAANLPFGKVYIESGKVPELEGQMFEVEHVLVFTPYGNVQAAVERIATTLNLKRPSDILAQLREVDLDKGVFCLVLLNDLWQYPNEQHITRVPRIIPWSGHGADSLVGDPQGTFSQMKQSVLLNILIEVFQGSSAAMIAQLFNMGGTT
ncbi:hypothetical protein JW766_02045 [Candidatus Dojkabacteria bacterium]|nr:hypothetical protein [Candidatus Dojkabacteria bacterium]